MATNKVSYLVDIVLVIDCTGSMRPVIDRVKSSALEFHTRIQERMDAKKKKIDSLRMRVIAFRDFWADNEPVRAMPGFVDMESESAEFESFVQDLIADGGGDEPESGLEALTLALQSPWEPAGNAKKRNIVVVWTDAGAHAFEKARETPPADYPAGMPANLDELTDAWDELPLASRRLLLYAPDTSPWDEIGYQWDQTIYFPSIAGEGLAEHDMNTILEAISNSI